MNYRTYLVLLTIIAVGCETQPPTPSDEVVVPIQFTFEFGIEQEPGAEDHIARTRLYDVTQAYDITGNAGTIELVGEDELFADGKQLDIETRNTFLTALRVDYSQTIPAGEEEYLFEFRRAGDERVEAWIPIPETFEIDEIGEVEDRGLGPTITWSPVIEGATVNITFTPITDDCVTILGGGDEGHVVQNLRDEGSYQLRTTSLHAPDKDCEYELIFVRRSVETEPAKWFREGEELPTNDVHGIGIHTARQTFIAKQNQ